MVVFPVLIVNAFTHQGKGGNPADVVLNADELTQLQKQEIAKQVGLSETAFISSSDKARHTLEFFTPNAQVALCGHAARAASVCTGNLD
jgi:PhzF family phenazine biosynthesis protein